MIDYKQVFVNRAKKEIDHLVYLGEVLPNTSKCFWTLVYGFEYLYNKTEEEDIKRKDLILKKITELINSCNLCK